MSGAPSLTNDIVANVISTASLLLGIFTALMGLWYADVSRAIDETEPELQGERDTLRKQLRPVLWGKAVPLAVGASVIAAVFFDRARTIVCDSLALYGKAWRYDDMMAAMVVTEVLIVTLAGVTLFRAGCLGLKFLRLWRRVEPRP